MTDFTVSLSDEEVKALEWDIADVQEWFENAIKNKARQCIDALVELHSDKQAGKISKAEKYHIVKQAVVEKAKDKKVTP